MKSRFLALAFFVLAIMAGQNSVIAQIHVDAVAYTNMNGIETQNTSDAGGGENVGWIDNNDWLDYEVTIPVTGEYRMDYRIASLGGNGSIQLRNGSDALSTLNLPGTGGWQEWVTVSSTPVLIEAGDYTFRLFVQSGGFNLNWWQMVLTTPVDTDKPSKPVVVSSTSTIHDVNIEWEASTDPTSQVGGYKIYLEEELFAITTDLSVSLSKLAPDKTFYFSLMAFDIAGNHSEPEMITIATEALSWDILWYEDFSVNGAPNTNHWNYQTGGGGWGNNEVQYYTNGENVVIEDGVLIIEARKEQRGTNTFTSTRMNTAGKVDILYGRIEVRAKLPRTGGTWPAIWMMPTDGAYGGWPNSGEIDIMEHTGNDYGHVFGTIHTGAYNHILGTQSGGGIDMDNVTDEFHTYTLEWYPTHMDWYIDDVHIFNFENEYKTSAEWPFDKHFHLLLNIAIGGNLGGTVDMNGVWPQQMIVDYIKVYDFNLIEQDDEAPEKVTQLEVDPKWTMANVTWHVAKDNVGISFYKVFIDGIEVGTTSGSSFSVTNLEPLTTYEVAIQAVDFAGNEGALEALAFSTIDVVSYAVPGRIEAEDYTNMHGIDTEETDDTGGGDNVGWIDANDWMSYTVDVVESDTYILKYRYASESVNGNVVLLDAEEAEITRTSLAPTGGWQNWQTLQSEPFSLTEGVTTIKVTTTTGGFNLNWLEFSLANGSSIPHNVAERYKFSVFPIPSTNGELNISLQGYSGDLQVAIFNLSGKSLYRKDFKQFSNTSKIDGLNLEKGIYVISVVSADQTYNEKLVVE